jgi:hypothetical protein
MRKVTGVKMWWKYFDVYSGGKQKTEWSNIYVEATSEIEANKIFTEKTGRIPDNVTCECCGDDYIVTNHIDLDRAIGLARGEMSVDEYVALPNVLVIGQ